MANNPSLLPLYIVSGFFIVSRHEKLITGNPEAFIGQSLDPFERLVAGREASLQSWVTLKEFLKCVRKRL